MSLAELQSKVDREELAQSIERQMQVLIGYRVYLWRWRYGKSLNEAAESEYAGELSQIENIKITTKNPKLIRPDMLQKLTENLEFKNEFELIFGDRLEMNALVSLFSLILTQLGKKETPSKSWQGTSGSFQDLSKSVQLLTRTGALKEAIADFDLVQRQNEKNGISQLFNGALTPSQFADVAKLLEEAAHAETPSITSHLFSWDFYELLEQRFGDIEDMKHLGRDIADWFLDVWLPHMVEKLDWYHADPITSTGKDIYQSLQRLTALQDQKVMIENTPVTDMLVSAETAEKNKAHALAYIDQKIRYEAVYFYHLVLQDDYFDKSQDSEDVMAYLELTEHQALRELLPKRVVDGKYEFMYSDHDTEFAKGDWAEIVERLEEVTEIRAEIDKKREGKGEDKRQKQKWAGMYVPELPGDNEE